MAEAPLDISVQLVRRLIDSQFPALAALPLHKVEPGGWDNRTFRLGEELAVRLPSAARYSPQIEREALALATLPGQLPLRIPLRTAQGLPAQGYPFAWAINRWVPGLPAGLAPISAGFGAQCGAFLARLHAIEPEKVLPPGPDNFYRGGPLDSYTGEVVQALARIADAALRSTLAARWARALESQHADPPRWVHGDFFPWNLLVDQTGQLTGVIDWGLVATGDPACDFALGWTCFDAGQRGALRQASGVGPATWDRARGWSLWKAVTLATGINPGTKQDIANSRAVLGRIADDDD